MKKILCTLTLLVAIASSLISCTEENVAPKTNEGTYSGGGIDPKGN
jgi:hypothetical protein